MLRLNTPERLSGLDLWFDLRETGKSKVASPTLVVAVSTSMPQYRALYSQARELANFMLEKMKFEEVASVRSSAFPPEVIVTEDGTAALPSCRFYLSKGKKKVLLFAGDTSPMDSQYEFASAILEFAKKLGVKEVVSVGARWAENPLPPEADPDVKGFATDEAGVEKLKQHGIKILTDEPAPFFASLVVALASEHGMRGYKLSVDHGEPIPHPRSVRRLLKATSALTGLESVEGPPVKASKEAPKSPAGDPTIYH